jgi:hypothetical protein
MKKRHDLVRPLWPFIDGGLFLDEILDGHGPPGRDLRLSLLSLQFGKTPILVHMPVVSRARAFIRFERRLLLGRELRNRILEGGVRPCVFRKGRRRRKKERRG